MQREIPVSALQDYLPHRSSAIWVDAVSRFNEEGGECRVRLSPQARYASAGTVRATSYVEWVAQAYGYAVAAWSRSRGSPPGIGRVFLVSISDFKLAEGAARLLITPGSELVVRAARTHQLGPIAVVQGEVSTALGRKLAEMRVKVFAEGSGALSPGSSPG